MDYSQENGKRLPDTGPEKARFPVSDSPSRLMRAILVHNPTAGTASHTAEQLTTILKEAGYSDVMYCSTKERQHKRALLSIADLVLIAGGDGTIAKVIRCLPQNDIPVAILPLGTANNVARSIGLHTDPELAARMSSRPQNTPL